MNTKLYVGNLSATVTEGNLRDLFSKKGKVSEIKMMLDLATGLPRGFAYVTMVTPAEAQAALDSLHSASLGGRYITVNEARPEAVKTGLIGESYTMKRHL